MDAGVSDVFFDKFHLDPEDIEMITAIRMTLEEEFKKEHENGTEVIFRHPNGKK